MLVCVFFYLCTRDRGCSAHPAFPAPSCLRDNETQTSGASRRERAGDLSGNYAGAQGSASIGVGAGGNVLVGGSNNSIALQPLSLQGQVGLNVAAGLESLELRPGR